MRTQSINYWKTSDIKIETVDTGNQTWFNADHRYQGEIFSRVYKDEESSSYGSNICRANKTEARRYAVEILEEMKQRES